MQGKNGLFKILNTLSLGLEEILWVPVSSRFKLKQQNLSCFLQLYRNFQFVYSLSLTATVSGGQSDHAALTLRKRELRHREVTCFVQRHTGSKRAGTH